VESFQRIAENRILDAIENGLFDNLQGKGKPLKFEDESHIPLELRMAYRILKNADCLPPELELRKEIVRLQDLVANMPDTAEKLQQMRRLNFLKMKMDMTRPVSAQLLEHDLYTPKVLDRLQTRPG
jgi:DnaJ homologue, subfamily C, member 28, conserved domain